jgi:hypothetical protein
MITLGSISGGDATININSNRASTNVLLVSQGAGNRTILASKNPNMHWKIILENNLTVTNNNASGINLYSEIIGSNDIYIKSTTGTPSISFWAPTYAGSYNFTTKNLFTGNITIDSSAYAQFSTNPTDFSGSAVNILSGGTFKGVAEARHEPSDCTHG